MMAGIGGALLAGLIGLALPNRYTSESRLLPKGQKGGTGLQLLSAAAALGVPLPSSDDGGASHLDILNSRWLGEQLLDAQYQFSTRGWRFGSSREFRGTLDQHLAASTRDAALRAIRTMLSVQKDPKTNLITLRVVSKSPELSLQMVQVAVKSLERFLKENIKTQGAAKAAFAFTRLEEANKAARTLEDQMRAFLSANRNYAFSTDPTVRLQGLRFESELALKRQLVATLAVSYEQALMEEKDDRPILNVLDAGALPTEKSGPNRGSLVLFGFLLAAIGAWAFQNQDQLRAMVLDKETA